MEPWGTPQVRGANRIAELFSVTSSSKLVKVCKFFVENYIFNDQGKSPDARLMLG